MELKHIDIANLDVSATNMRGVKKAPDLTNILPSVRARGVLVPLIVRRESCPEPAEGGSPETYEIIAGKRRYHAALIVAEENGGISDPLPCAVMAAGDDAAALEASIIENIARLDPLGHVSRLSFDRKNKRMVCLFQAARSAYPKSWRRAAWNKHLRGGCGIVPLAIGGDESVTRTPLGLSARLSAPHI